MKEHQRVRKATVAGMFYPGDATTLRSNLNSLLNSVDVPPPSGRPVVLVEPHAGYQYSGRVAAHGYKLLLDRDIRTVVVISPSHVEYFAGVSAFAGDAYETPLGTVDVDQSLVDTIVDANPLIEKSQRGHVQERRRGEHALEVQLPFLQAVLRRFTIVPVVMGDQSWEYCRALGDALGPVLQRPDVLIVASSDLSHFYSDKVARKLDEVFLERLTAMDPRQLYESVQNKSCEACGAGPVIAALIAASYIESPTCRVLSTANSGDVTGDRSQVVGYASAVVLESGKERLNRVATESDFALNADERSYLLKQARHAIGESLGITQGKLPAKPDSTVLGTSRGCFVTLKIGGRLRGCIGIIEPKKPLSDIVSEMARAAAFSDPRFSRLSPEELSEVRIEISVLSPLQEITGPESIEVGRHGLVVERGGRRGLLLPQVAGEFGWDAITFLERTSEKAGLAPDAWADPSSKVLAFSATVFAEEAESLH
jgi:AmmeMemoRadiSam system protein B/AmmeMemoRadiSam system protein A